MKEASIFMEGDRICDIRVINGSPQESIVPSHGRRERSARSGILEDALDVEGG
jgi:hypothetical protein